MKYDKVELYGGAITSQFPSGLLDASTLRQVPDTQEVFLNPTDNTTDYTQLNKNDSIIIDLMEKLEVNNDEDAIREHFNEISQLNSTNEWRLLSINQIQSNFNKSYISIGIEPARKWGRDESNETSLNPSLVVILGLIRIDKAETDLLITFNLLVEDKEELTDLFKLNEIKSLNLLNNKVSKRIQLANEIVEHIIKNLKIEDWNLFG